MKLMLEKLEGYIAIPHELLHVAGYRIVGQRCIYRWGEPRVKPIGPMNRQQRLVGLLFPFFVSVITFLCFTFASAALVAAYPALITNSYWAISFGILAIISGIYALFCIGDLRRAYQVWQGLGPDSPTPFDFKRLQTLQKSLINFDIKIILILIALTVVLLIST